LTFIDDIPQERITVVIADDHRLALQGLARAVDHHPELELVAQARDGAAALAAIEEFCPDVALIDVRMPGLDGVDLCARVTDEPTLPTRIVLLTAFPTNGVHARAREAGAVTCLDKETSRQELCDALVAAAST
jgi:two-component system nitrate/nitrite response regulator NarL